MNGQMTRLIKRAGKYETSVDQMENVCEVYAKENDCKLTYFGKNWKWAYTAEFRAADGGEFGGVMIAVKTNDPNWPEEVDIIFGPGQMVGSKGQHVVEADEYYEELGIGE